MALSPKQKKIAKMAGDPNKIEGEDFKAMKADVEGSAGPFMMKNKGGVMKAKYGKMVMSRGCKMGKNKPTKLS